jgi:hypothetical protein
VGSAALVTPCTSCLPSERGRRWLPPALPQPDASPLPSILLLTLRLHLPLCCPALPCYTLPCPALLPPLLQSWLPARTHVKEALEQLQQVHPSGECTQQSKVTR